MTGVGDRITKLVPADGRWYSKGNVIRLVTTPGNTPPDRIEPDPRGDYEVLSCVNGHVRDGAWLFVDLRKIR